MPPPPLCRSKFARLAVGVRRQFAGHIPMLRMGPLLRGSCRPPYSFDKSGNFSCVLDAFTLLHAARHIHGIRAHPADSLADVLRSQSARENQGLAQIMWHAVPVEYLAGTSGRVRDIGIEQQPGGVTI